MEIRSTQNGRLAQFTLATDERWKDRETGGKWHERTERHRVVSFHTSLAEALEKGAKKSRLVTVIGKLGSRRSSA